MHLRSILAEFLVHPRENAYKGTHMEEAYARGYHEGVSDSMVLIGMILAMVTFIIVAMCSTVYLPLRRMVRPWAMREVEREIVWVKAVQKYNHPIADVLLDFAAFTCSVPFYITFLPFLFWSGELRLARHLTILCAVLIYVGNAIKDIICSPRPDWNNGVRIVCKEQAVAEYGLPSTHTINTIAVIGYLMLFDYKGDGNTSVSVQTWILSSIWCFIIMYGRIYLGMHSPIDVAAGIVLALACLFFYLPLSDYVDSWITSDCHVPLYQLVFSNLLIFSYPKPMKPTPSYEYAVYFTGVVLGVITGIWRSDYHTEEAAAVIAIQRGGELLTYRGMTFAFTRFVPGMVCVLAARSCAKPAVQMLLQFILSPFPESTTKNWDKKPIERLLTYATVGWVVVSPCFKMFEVLGI